MINKAFLTVLGLMAIAGCSPSMAPMPAEAGVKSEQIVIPPGSDIAMFVWQHPRYDKYLLETGEYKASNGESINRSHMVIAREDANAEPVINDAMQINGDDNVLDGLIWDAGKGADIRRSDPGTLAINGKHNIVRNCIFRNFATDAAGFKIILIGRLKTNGQFTNTVSDSNTIETCTFDNWGLRNQPKGSTASSACIMVGEEDDKGKFTGTVIRKNLFINGPYMSYGYNAACKIFNSVLLEDNNFFGGQECMEVKYGNCTIRGNIIHHFSGYNILGDRGGRNSLYEYNTVYDVTPTDPVSSTQGFMVWECGNTVYRNNLFYDCQTSGRVPGEQTPQNTIMQYLLIENNSFINNRRGIIFDNKYGSPRHMFITRNIFYAPGAAATMWALSGEDTTQLDYYADNLYYGNVRETGDRAPVDVNPQFVDTVGHDYRLAPNSPVCGYGALPCGAAGEGGMDSTYDLAHYVVLYPTGDKWFFHVGLSGLDIQPIRLEIDDPAGKVLLKKNAPEPGFKVFPNIDLRSSHLTDYVLKMYTDKDKIITKRVHIE